jgi:hypothetical protein
MCLAAHHLCNGSALLTIIGCVEVSWEDDRQEREGEVRQRMSEEWQAKRVNGNNNISDIETLTRLMKAGAHESCVTASVPRIGQCVVCLLRPRRPTLLLRDRMQTCNDGQ